MWAKIDLTDDVVKFVNEVQENNETFEEIRELVFTKERLNTNYSAIEILQLSMQFNDIKHSALHKIINNQPLNFSEGFLIERLMAKYMNEDYISVEEHVARIRNNCSNDKLAVDEQKKISKLSNNIFVKLFGNIARKKGDI